MDAPVVVSPLQFALLQGPRRPPAHWTKVAEQRRGTFVGMAAFEYGKVQAVSSLVHDVEDGKTRRWWRLALGRAGRRKLALSDRDVGRALRAFGMEGAEEVQGPAEGPTARVFRVAMPEA